MICHIWPSFDFLIQVVLAELRELAQRCGNDAVLRYIPKGTSYKT